MITRVLHIVPATSKGVIPPFVERQIGNMADLGYEPALVQFRGDYISHNPRALASEVSTIRQEIRRWRPHLVHAHWGSLLAATAGLATRPRTPFIVTFRGSDLNPVVTEKTSRYLMRNALSQFAAVRASKIVCVSDQLRDRIRVHQGDVQVIPDGLDMRLFFPRDRERARHELGWTGSGPTIFLYQGDRPVEKGRPLADAAIAYLHSHGVDTDATRGEVALMLNASDCVLMLSDFEGSPNIVRESVACGVPVVSVEVGDVARWLTVGTGSLIVERSPAAVAAGIKQVIRNARPSPVQATLESMSEASTARNLARVYELALAKSGRSVAE